MPRPSGAPPASRRWRPPSRSGCPHPDTWGEAAGYLGGGAVVGLLTAVVAGVTISLGRYALIGRGLARRGWRRLVAGALLVYLTLALAALASVSL